MEREERGTGEGIEVSVKIDRATHAGRVRVLQEEDDDATIRLSQSLVYLQHNAPLHVEYRCGHGRGGAVVGVDVRLRADRPAGRDRVVFSQRWTCDGGDGDSAGDLPQRRRRRRTVRLRLPRYVAYRPAANNRYSVSISQHFIGS